MGEQNRMPKGSVIISEVSYKQVKTGVQQGTIWIVERTKDENLHVSIRREEMKLV